MTGLPATAEHSEWGWNSRPHWTRTRLKALFREVDVRAGSDDVPLLALTQRGLVPRSGVDQRASVADDYANYKVCRPGDLVMNKMQAWNGAFAVADQVGMVSPDYTVLRAHGDIGLRYFLFLFRSEPLRNVFRTVCRGMGTAFLRLNTDDFGSLAVPMPPAVEERKSIAEFLDRETAKIDALIAKKQQVKRLTSSEFRAAVDDSLACAKSRHVVRLKFLIRGIEQGWSPECENRIAVEDEWGVLKAGCVNGGFFDEREHKALPRDVTPEPMLEVRQGDLLVSRANGSPDLVGSAAVVRRCRPRLLLSDKIFRLNVNTDLVSAEYLSVVMMASNCRDQILLALSGGNGLANNISQANLLDLRVCVTESMEQRRILQTVADRRSRSEVVDEKASIAIERLREYRSALITAAVTGQIDVRDRVA